MTTPPDLGDRADLVHALLMAAPDQIKITHQRPMTTSPTICAALDAFQRAANRGTAVHLSPELVRELCDALKAKPETPAEALAARPLLEQVAALADCIGANTVGQITAISNRAAAWLRANPPGQPRAIEPRGCPTPGACSCVEPASPAPEQGDAWWHELINEIARVQHVAQGEGQGPRFDLAKAVELSRRPTPPAPEPGEAKELHPLWYLVEFLEGHSSFRRRTEPTDELAEILSNSATLLQQQESELAALREVPVAESKLDDAFMAGVCVSLALVTAHGEATIWREIVRSVGADNLLDYAANVNPDDWDLAGFGEYAQSELGKGKPAPAPQAGEGEA